MFVYFIQAGESGPVKVGWAADPAQRMLEMQTGNHHELVLLGYVPGTLTQEHELHKRFAAGCVRGEWFAYDTPGLRDEVSRAIRWESEYELSGQRLCVHCRTAPVMPPRTKVCSDACYIARKRSITSAWRKERRT